MFDLEPLRDMVEEDVAHWDQNLEAARQDAARMETEILEFVAKSSKKMKSLMLREPTNKSPFSLRMMPLWGEAID